SLHIFEHVHGESRERGQAMIDLRESYTEQGLLMTSDELPDYLPACLEFVSLLPVEEARHALADPVHVLQPLHDRLRERVSPYTEQGLWMTSDELPDYLPAFLELVSLLPVEEARQALAEPVHVLQALHDRLRERG